MRVSEAWAVVRVCQAGWGTWSLAMSPNYSLRNVDSQLPLPDPPTPVLPPPGAHHQPLGEATVTLLWHPDSWPPLTPSDKSRVTASQRSACPPPP